MGANQFETKARAKTADEAFDIALKQAQYDHGHGGYTGTLAEKREFKIVELKPSEDPAAAITRVYREGAKHWIDDKWGPAGCIDAGTDDACKRGEHVFIFFGWASS